MRRNKHNLSHTRLLSMDTGALIPCGLVEALPGDTFQHNTSVLVRASPMLAPIMHKVDVCVHHWFVPHRLVWDEWEDFITGGPDGDDTSSPPTKTVDNNDVPVGALMDHYGIPPDTATTFSILPARGYNMIWNQFYRDQDLDTEAAISLAGGADTTTHINTLRVRWQKDYFTSARPWEQKGPSITLPLGDTAPVEPMFAGGVDQPLAVIGTLSGQTALLKFDATGTTRVDLKNPSGAFTDDESLKIGNNIAALSGLQADISGASGITVNALREFLASQRYMEARARYGSRYPEYLRYLGVRSSDARLQRPEYLGGGRSPLQFSEVLQTAEGDDPVGEMRGHGIGAMRSNRYRRFFEEHGFVHSFIFVRPKAIYTNGQHRMFNRVSKEDYWQKEFETIGQQEVLNKEVYAAHVTPNGVFGFQDRYSEYRGHPSTISGEFRTLLDHWHMARIFTSAPALNSTFVACIPPDDRVFASSATDVLYCMCRHSLQARRLVSRTGKSLTF